MTGRIDGWKSIGGYFGRDRTTAMRWAEARGMPVHRVPGGKRASVFAYRHELDEWLKAHLVSDAAREPDDAAEPAPPSRTRLRWRWAVAILFVLVLGGIAIWQLRAPATALVLLPRDTEVVRLYLQARDDWAERSAASIDRAIAALEEVVRREPGFAPAHAGLADAWLLAREFGSQDDAIAFPHALAAANRALALDPASHAAHRARGFILYWWEDRPHEAGQAFRRALALAPWDAQTRFWYGNALSDNGAEAAALHELDAARAHDPGSVAIRTDLAWAHWAAGRREQALAMLERLEESHPRFAVVHDCIAYIRLAEGDHAGFVAAFERVARLRGNPDLLAEAAALRAALSRSVPDLQHLLLHNALAEVAAGKRRNHAVAAFHASLARDRGRLTAILRRAVDRGERWGSAGFVMRIVARWTADPEIATLLARLRQPPMI